MASVIAVVVVYGISVSDKADTVQSWSCRWDDRFMVTRPHFGTLCKQSLAVLYLVTLLVPIEAANLVLASYQAVLERNAPTNTMEEGMVGQRKVWGLN